MERGLMVVTGWRPAAGKSAQESLCADFNIAAELIDDEYGVFERYNDLADRREYVFLTEKAAGAELARRHPGRISGPHRPVIALTGG